MKDRWMNVGYDEKELKTYNELEQDFNDVKRIGQTHTHTHLYTHVQTCKNTYTHTHSHDSFDLKTQTRLPT